jgi:MarR family transcriptional regulator, organic hydroperoxide resistance regulator
MNAAHEDLQSWWTGQLLTLSARLAERAWAEFLGHWGVSIGAFAILKALDAGPASQAELAARCRVGPQSLGRTLDRLERAGLVRRERDQADRRQIGVVRTSSGDRTVADVMALAAQGQAALFDSLPDHARFRADLLHVIDFISDALRRLKEQAA